ncbi:hypothetical protein [Pontibacter sp. G13]|uniref:hypothetical protein n=1 Tax=Pontibacter sp. G13 TaxID=3074898 RepID=UPI00288A7A6D|nr:hypothetical protein [Pontibacter sp. G13]WNJ18308.1 hypothetical protein RJD25_25935 [Pontibacter sp. G13]
MRPATFAPFLLLSCSFLFIQPAFPQKRLIRTAFYYGGYVKFDALYSWYRNGEVGPNSALRDFIFPAQIPVGSDFTNETFDFHVKESRFNFDVTTELNQQEIHGFLEMDFLLSPGGDEKVSNSFNPRLRHFYFEWKQLLVGQTWSSFMIVIVPDDLDFSGSLEGLVFVRQPKIRYNWGTWMFGIENPETLYLPFNAQAQEVSDKEFLPDFVLRKDFSGEWGTWTMAGIYRTLSFKDTTAKYRSSAFGFTTGGKLLLGKRGDDFRMTLTAGSGLGRYVAGNFMPGGVFKTPDELVGIPTFNGYVAYNHFWIRKTLSSTFNAGYFKYIGGGQSIDGLVNDRSYSLSANLKYDPVSAMRFGLEFSYANRKLIDGTSGGMFRLQFSAKYTFGYTDETTVEK